MVVTKIPVWVKLRNIPLPFWHYKVLEDINNTLAIFKKMDVEIMEKGLFTFVDICVEIGLNKGLIDYI